MAMQDQTVTYQADGLTLKSRLFFEPGSGKRPAVLVFPEIFGLGDHAIGRAKRLVDEGYVAMACDIHGDGKRYEDLQEAMGQLQIMYADRNKIRARARAALDLLKARPEVDGGHIAAIGHCFGGTMAIELARSGADVKAVVGFHSGLSSGTPKTDPKTVRGKVLVCIGADDSFISPQERADFEAEMRAGDVDWQMHLYGGVVHSFTDPEADKRGMPQAMRYSASAERRSWEAMQELFSDTMR